MVSIKEPRYTDATRIDPESICSIGDGRAKTRSAVTKAVRLAEWVSAQKVLLTDPEQETPDERDLFGALQTCAYRSTRGGRRKGSSAPDSQEWAERWRLLRDYLIRQNTGLAYKMLARFRASRLDRDDLRGEALLALIRATERFDPWRGFRFSTYACRAIVRALIQAARKSNRGGFQLVLEPEIAPEQSCDRGDWSDLYVDRLRRALRDNKGELTDRESTILAGRFPMNGGSRHTLSQIGGAIGLSKERVRQIQNIALTKLRGVMEADPVLQ